MTAVIQRTAPGRLGPAPIACVVLGVATGAVATIDFVLALCIVAAIGALYALRWPDLATVLLAAVLYSNAVVVATRFQSVPATVGVLPPALLLLPLVHHFIVRREAVVWTSTTTFLLIFAVGASLSLLFSDDLSSAAGPYATFVAEGLVMFVLLTNVVRSWRLLRLIVVTVVVVGAAIGTMSLAAHLLHRDYASFKGFAQVTEGSVTNASDWRTWEEWKAGPMRASGPLGEPNFYALTMSLLLPFAGYLAYTARSRIRQLAAFAALGLIGAGVVLSLSRGAAVAIFVGVGLLSALGVLPRRTLVFLAACGVVLLATVPSYRERLAELDVAGSVRGDAYGNQADGSVMGRYSEMIAATRVFADHPVVGVGLGQFGAHYEQYSRDLGISVHEGPRDAHNLYLGLGAEVGLVGLICYLGIVVTLLRGLLIVRRRRSSNRDEAALATALIASITLLLVNGLFLHIAYMRYMWFLFALAAIAVNLDRQGSARGLRRSDTLEQRDVMRLQEHHVRRGY
jgi:O-antigen ligase/polysaccharide polymerase Wzy-like membrane protein